MFICHITSITEYFYSQLIEIMIFLTSGFKYLQIKRNLIKHNCILSRLVVYKKANDISLKGSHQSHPTPIIRKQPENHNIANHRVEIFFNRIHSIIWVYIRLIFWVRIFIQLLESEYFYFTMTMKCKILWCNIGLYN